MREYKLLLVSQDGDYVTEGNDLSKDEAISLSEDMGSKWIFYPYHFIIKDYLQISPNQRIILTGDGLEHLKGMTLKKLFESFKSFGPSNLITEY